MPTVAVLAPLRADHASAVLAFEQANRAYFAASISDRGDEYFAHFTDNHRASLAAQETGLDRYHLLVGADGSVLGRFNLYDIGDDRATLGYRVAQRVAGRGVATAGALALCGLARRDHDLVLLDATTTDDNVASRSVLTKVGFAPAGAADLGGRPAMRYERVLTSDDADTAPTVVLDGA